MKTLFLKEFGDVDGCVNGVHDEVPQLLIQTRLNRYLVFLINRLYQLIELTKVASLSLLELFEDLNNLGILAPDILLSFDLLQLEFLLEKLSLYLLYLNMGLGVFFVCVL